MRRYIAVTMLLMLSTLPFAGRADDFDDGWQAYLAKDYDTAFALWQPLADGGNIEAQYWLGMMYFWGWGVRSNDTKAAHYNRLAAEQDYAFAQENLAWSYYNGEGVPKDIAQAAQWFIAAAEQDLPHAQYFLFSMYRHGDGVTQDDARAVSWLTHAAEQGHTDAQTTLGLWYRDGDGVPQDNNRAAHWLETAAMQKHTYAQYLLGVMLTEDGTHGEALVWFEAAARQGHGVAQMELARAYHRGESVPQDDVAAYVWMSLAISNGEKQAANLRKQIASSMTKTQIRRAQKRLKQCRTSNGADC